MKNLLSLLVCIAALSCMSCKKDSVNPDGLDTDYFVFGDAYGMCYRNCTHLFLLNEGKLYPDSMDRGLLPLVFQGTPMSSDKADKARHLLSIFPASLKTGKDLTIGCPDCHDQGTYYIEYREGSATRIIRIDTDEDTQPAAIKSFIATLRTTIDDLKK